MRDLEKGEEGGKKKKWEKEEEVEADFAYTFIRIHFHTVKQQMFIRRVVIIFSVQLINFDVS